MKKKTGTQQQKLSPVLGRAFRIATHEHSDLPGSQRRSNTDPMVSAVLEKVEQSYKEFKVITILGQSHIVIKSDFRNVDKISLGVVDERSCSRLHRLCTRLGTT